MTHTPRTLSLVAALLLTLAACNDDLTQTTATTPGGDLAGQPVQFSTTALSVTPAGSPQTRAAEPETDFPAEGTTMTVYLLADDGTPIQQADYTYSATGGWTSTAPLRWPASTGTYRFTAISPAAMSGACTDGTTLPLTLPTEWTAADLATYAQLRTTSAATETEPTTTGVTLSLHHPLAKIQVISTSSAPVYLTDAPATGTVTLDGTTTAPAPTTAGLVQLATSTDDPLTYQGYVLPTTTAFGILADKLLNLTLPAGGLQAGTSLTTTSATDVTIISCTTPGTLADVWPADNPEKVLITGTLNADDITTLNSHKNEITHLYVTANAENDTDWEELDLNNSSSITKMYLAQATGITTIAFFDCTSLTSVSLPKATDIKTNAFFSCTALASVSLPQATNIGSGAFSGCTALASVSLPKATDIGSSAFFDCTALASVSLPKATYIGSNAFFDCTALASVSLPKATNIGFSAFFDCTSLINVNLPQATDIGSSAFSGCTFLTNVSLPKATNIDSNAFFDCTSLTSVSLPQATNIGSSAFFDCTSLTSICLPQATYIGSDTFFGCTALISICLPTDVEFGSLPFYGCSKLTTLYLNCPEADFNEATYSNYGDHTWQHIYYGYRGTGDYLAPASYTGHWTATNP